MLCLKNAILFLKFMNQVFMSVPLSFPTICPHFGQRGCLMFATVGQSLQCIVALFENTSAYHTYGNEITVSYHAGKKYG
jgi:hypothetical protein